ncbi:Membrane protein involved in the export of O-antigen and teichoic acid [Chryseobacterium oranimense]|uniref:Membrane protein involved in the export of O-antigen and teichoic acid n=1 Tax=Chryseobacterium oranimense TaxID=421058 RepID=A0A1M5LYH4_9FLAO|nr:flippase [Chryseobacterium oranimense]SHG69699.1 Membrane protein involved in the export of O-antigen and teichoic acid [Chryseobacterium oranimense]
MKERSVKTNYFLNLFRVASSALVGVFIMPYINKILGPESIGKVEYVYVIINYFILFSALGIPMYGIREISKVKNNLEERTKATVELLSILFITSILSYIILLGVLYNLNYFASYKDLILLMSSMIFLTNIGAEWYFQGMEDQLYITVRYVIVRVVTIFLIFYSINSPDDYLMYAFIMVLTICGSNLFNLFYLVKTLNFKSIKIRELHLKRHMKPVLTIFVATISVNIYLQLDNFLIGSLVGDKYVGYYSVSNKLVRFVISFITIIGTVMLPRLSSLYNTDLKSYYMYLKQSFNIILLLAIPSTIIFLVYAENIINLMAGPEFKESIVTMQIMSPLCIIVGLAYFIGYLLLYTQHKEKIYTIAVIISALFSLSVNFFIIKLYYHNGAALVSVLAELFAIVIMFYIERKEVKKMSIFNRNFIKIIFCSIIVFSIALLIKIKIDLSNVFILLISLALSYILYYLLLFIVRETTISEFVYIGLNKLKKTNK